MTIQPSPATPRSYLLIGGNSGIGFATACLLHAQGDSVIAAARSPGPLKEMGIPVRDAKREAAAKRHPLQQVGNPDDIAALTAFLLSDAARFLTGQVLRPDGGLSSVSLFS